jgi:hypothetical protein
MRAQYGLCTHVCIVAWRDSPTHEYLNNNQWNAWLFGTLSLVRVMLRLLHLLTAVSVMFVGSIIPLVLHSHNLVVAVVGPPNIGEQSWWDFWKFEPLCQDAKSKKFPHFVMTTSGIHHFCQNLSRLYTRVRNLPKLSRLVHQGSKNRPGPSGMAYKTVRKPFGFGNDHKLAFSYYSKGTSLEPPPPLSFVTVFFTPFLLAAFRNFTACPTHSNFCFSLENISKYFPFSWRVHVSCLE